MTTPKASTLLAFANVQMAAEAVGIYTAIPQNLFAEQLEIGNRRSSKFTPAQAAAFAGEWQVVDHKPNTGTGFSGTLFMRDGVRSCLLLDISTRADSARVEADLRPKHIGSPTHREPAQRSP